MGKLVKKKMSGSFRTTEGLRVKLDFWLAVGSTWEDLFRLGSDIERFSGLSVEEGKRYKKAGSYIFSLCNIMNGGKDVFFFTDGARMKEWIREKQKVYGKDVGYGMAMTERLSYEFIHLARLCVAKTLLEPQVGDRWVEVKWPEVGEEDEEDDDGDIYISEADLVEIVGHLVEMAYDDFELMLRKV